MFKKCSAVLMLLWCMSLCPVVAQAQDAGLSSDEFIPYVELPTILAPEARRLNRRVLLFVNFGCPYCRAVHPLMDEWGKGLPNGFSYEVVPAYGTPEHGYMVMAYYTVLQAAPEKLRDYVERLYGLIQDQHRSPERVDTYVVAAEMVGISRERFLKAAQSEAVRGYVMRARALTEAYGLQEVPTVVVGNRFMTGPARVQNRLDAFMTVMNGLVSMLYEEQVRMSQR